MSAELVCSRKSGQRVTCEHHPPKAMKACDDVRMFFDIDGENFLHISVR